MPEEVLDAPAASSPAPDALAAPSAEPHAEPTQVSEPGTPPTTQPVTPQFNMPPAERWEELRQQKTAAEQRAAQAEQLAQLALQKLQTGGQPSSPAVDYWAGKVDHPDATTARYWQEQRAMVEPLYQAVKGLQDAVDAGRKELAEVKVDNFRLRNPNIAPNSEDEKLIAGYVGQGYPMDAAKKLALYDRLESENQALKAKQGSVSSKVAANQTGPTQGMPATAGLPGKPGDWRENVRQAFRKGGGLAEVVNAAGASRAQENE